MATHEVTFPITDEAEILKLRAGDEVTVQGHIIGIRDRTQIRIFDQGVEPPMDLSGAFLLHTAPGVRKLGRTARYEKVCIGTTTSARMVRFTEPLGTQYGVRAICGKGGFPDEAIEPMHKLGMVYFAIVGGAAALETTQIEEIEEVAWEELMPECLWKFRVKDFGPLTVGIDAHGNSLYHDVQTAAQDKLKELFARLDSSSRAFGLTHVLDKGLGPRGWEDVLEMAGDYISIVKLGWGTAYVTRNLERKLAVLREKPVVIGGTFFEAVYATGDLDEYKQWLAGLGLTHVEISDGTVDIPRERKLELIADFARDFTVLSEVGSKDSSVEYTRRRVDHWLREDLAAGAWKVITEAREGGTAGIFDSSGGMRTELIGEIAERGRPGERHLRGAVEGRAGWFIKHFGPSVNLGNIPPEEVIPLETLRLGLRGDTLKEVLLGDDAATPA